MSSAAGDFIDQAAAAGRRIVVSSISPAEIVYLIEKNRLPANAYADLKAAIADPDHVFKEAPFTVEIVDAMRQVPRADVPDMPDRIVAATGLYFGAVGHQPRQPHPDIQPANGLVARRKAVILGGESTAARRPPRATQRR